MLVLVCVCVCGVGGWVGAVSNTTNIIYYY